MKVKSERISESITLNCQYLILNITPEIGIITPSIVFA